MKSMEKKKSTMIVKKKNTIVNTAKKKKTSSKMVSYRVYLHHVFFLKIDLATI